MSIFKTLFRLFMTLCLLSEMARNVSGEQIIKSVTWELEISIKFETTVIQSYQPPAPECKRPSRPVLIPSYKDCNRAFYNLGFKDGMLRTQDVSVKQTYGNCAIEVRCGGHPITVSAGRLLADVDANKSGGYKNLASTCLVNDQIGKVFVAGGCSVEVWHHSHHSH
ncbi:uncharacterized protein MELLADRAFT_124155 [Melampsora larici-populina 98AG31]|uniref:Secreted protein n=1 Tax=Melampsora larici-populina (strain 98AG31 / pathotype 3-4-7) TaxID=747676 RepID=F4RB74_MELLP|nr:uncharacterized protein MELLADRAFT_124155 [Melampsora larici-populina 98AG31]EGG10029.1 secreted protein [Melampsora larici-populina 98AG31]